MRKIGKNNTNRGSIIAKLKRGFKLTKEQQRAFTKAMLLDQLTHKDNFKMPA